MKDPIIPDFCYDFPEAVLHTPNCPRYTGGICHPLPQPDPPVTDEEKSVVEAYEHAKQMIRRGVMPGVPVYPSGTTGETMPRIVH